MYTGKPIKQMITIYNEWSLCFMITIEIYDQNCNILPVLKS